MNDYFKQLNYTLGDEDATFEMTALEPECPHVLAIADCGSRIVPLLARSPAKLTWVDISPEQLALAKLRLSLLRTVDCQTYCDFLGFSAGMTPVQRRAVFTSLPLEDDASALLSRMMSGIGWGALVYEGKFERMLLTLSKITRAILGSATDKVFECSTVDAQAEFYHHSFPKFRWRLVLALLGNSTALNSLLYKGNFPKKNIQKSYFKVYHDIFFRLLTRTVARKSFFLQLIFLGKVKYAEGLPIECEPAVFAAAQRAVKGCDISYVEGDVLEALSRIDSKIGFLSFSDVPSFLPDVQALGCLQSARRSLLPGALVVVRGHVRLVKPELAGYLDVSSRYAEIASRETTGLWDIATYQVA